MKIERPLFEIFNDTDTMKSLYKVTERYALKLASNANPNDGKSAEILFNSQITGWRENKNSCKTRENLFEILALRSVNTGRGTTVFGGSSKNRKNQWGNLKKLLKNVTHDFDVNKIMEDNKKTLTENIRQNRKCIVGTPIDKTTTKMVDGLAKSLQQSAKHILDHEYEGDPKYFADSYRERYSAKQGEIADPYRALENIRQLSQEIHGIGFALSCDLLKEIGLSEYGKPDTHVMDILPYFSGNFYKGPDNRQEAVGQCLLDLIRTSNAVGVEPYEFDKIIYIVGSGNMGEGNELLKTEKKRKADLATLLRKILGQQSYVVPGFFYR